MPVAALGLDDKTSADMARAGLRRIGDLAMRPRAPIAARFGAEAIARLDALSGVTRERDLAAFRRARLLRRAALRQPDRRQRGGDGDACRLADDLVALLARQMKGARRLELALFRVDGDVRRIVVGCRPAARRGARHRAPLRRAPRRRRRGGDRRRLRRRSDAPFLSPRRAAGALAARMGARARGRARRRGSPISWTA